MEKPKTLSLEDLLNSDKKYIIPVYQRNYSWREPEIQQLIQDVWDKYNDNQDSFYYIGTLIVDDRGHSFEIIDGQQRFTTIILINAIIQKEFDYKTNSQKASNLKFDSRPKVENYIRQVYLSGYDDSKNPQETECQNIHSALKIIKNCINKSTNKNKIGNLNGFIAYFYKNVKIIQVEVPEGTDINHYFEIMNTRGEQLEAHEIIKAWLVKNCEETKRKEFAKIWDACSQMNMRIQTFFENEEIEETSNDEKDDDSLENILKSDKSGEYIQTKTSRNKDKYRSVIDFPNFLLIVLQIFNQNEKISLDDKNLLKTNGFGYTDNSKTWNAETTSKFVSFLLQCRILFDNYIIKQEEIDNKTDWFIRSPKYNNDKQISWVNTFGKDTEKETEVDDDLKCETDDFFGLKDMIMLQTMLHVSFPGNSYKYWLLDALSWLAKNRQNTGNIGYNDFMNCLIEITKEEYKKESERITFTYHNTERFVFNLLDYLLWKEYKKGQIDNFIDSHLKNDEKQYSGYINKYFKPFKFRGGNSIEHLLPQNHKHEIDADDKDVILNSFGNLCLVSAGNNSRYSDFGFNAKKELFFKQDSTESLKQAVMFSHERWKTKDQINVHEELMMKLLNDFGK